MNMQPAIIALAILLGGCGGDTASEESTGGSRSVTTVPYAESSAAMAPCKALAEQYPALEARVAALHKLADTGAVCAQYGLGTLYVMGYQSVAADSSQAQHYLQMAAAQGHTDAARELVINFPD